VGREDGIRIGWMDVVMVVVMVVEGKQGIGL
jgi:hypothetical protein